MSTAIAILAVAALAIQTVRARLRERSWREAAKDVKHLLEYKNKMMEELIDELWQEKEKRDQEGDQK